MKKVGFFTALRRVWRGECIDCGTPLRTTISHSTMPGNAFHDIPDIQMTIVDAFCPKCEPGGEVRNGIL